MKNVLVTGADGFIGSHLAETLVRRGYNVRAMVLYNSFDAWGWLDESPREIRHPDPETAILWATMPDGGAPAGGTAATGD